MSEKQSLKRVREMREMTYMLFTDALKGLKQATRLIDERVQKEGPNANYSANCDLLEWSQAVWRHSQALYTFDQIIESLSNEKIVNEEAQDDDVVTPGDAGSGG